MLQMQALCMKGTSCQHVCKLSCRCRHSVCVRKNSSCVPEGRMAVCTAAETCLHVMDPYTCRYQQATQGNVVAGGKSLAVQLSPEHLSLCKAGTARMHIKLGNATKGSQLASECGEAVCVEVGIFFAVCVQLDLIACSLSLCPHARGLK